MIVNLFDYNFKGSACSVAWATPQRVEYVRDRYKWDGLTVFTDAYIHNPIVDQVSSPIKIGWLHEPFCLHPPEYEAATKPEIAAKFDTIITYKKEFVLQYHMTFGIYGGVWVPGEWWGMHRKSKLVSMLYGSKKTTLGHQLRHQIGEHFESGIDYYGFKGEAVDYSPQTKVRVHKDYMFSIVTETCREDWLFTEILLDCFALGTIPIFWGCPGIGTFFDERGILSFENIDELDEHFSNLSPALYKKMQPYAQKNMELTLDYSITEDWLYEHVLRRYA